MRRDEEKRKHEDFIQGTIKAAQQRAPKTNDLSDAERIRGIRKNRENEKKEERQQKNQKNNQKTTSKKGKTIPFKENTVENYDYPDLIEELFDKDEN